MARKAAAWLAGAGWSRLIVSASALLLLMMTSLVSMLQTNSAEGAQPPSEARPRDGFASDRSADPASMPFDGERAFQYLKQICAIGPRVSGSLGMKKQQELLQKHFDKPGVTLTWQRFQARQRSRGKETVEMANLVVSWFPERSRRVILCSHYDTRPIADQEWDPRKWREPFLSANDGGSGVALLMELAHHLKDLNPHVGVDFVFFDGEEYIFDRQQDEYFFGSKHFAAEYRKQNKVQYAGAILLDMVGGKNAKFPIEQHSWWKAERLVREVYGLAAELKSPVFRGDQFSRVAVEDDHIALNRVGIPAIDIIDFDYPHWHRLTDTPENCSGETLTQVAKVLALWLQRVR